MHTLPVFKKLTGIYNYVINYDEFITAESAVLTRMLIVFAALAFATTAEAGLCHIESAQPSETLTSMTDVKVKRDLTDARPTTVTVNSARLIGIYGPHPQGYGGIVFPCANDKPPASAFVTHVMSR